MREIVTAEGRLVVHESAVAAAARAAALRCPGVAGTLKRGLPEEIRHLLGRETGTALDEGGHGVEIELDQKSLVVDIGITVRFGAHIPTVARQVVAAIETEVAGVFGFHPRRISVHVLGVRRSGGEGAEAEGAAAAAGPASEAGVEMPGPEPRGRGAARWPDVEAGPGAAAEAVAGVGAGARVHPAAPGAPDAAADGGADGHADAGAGVAEPPAVPRRWSVRP